MHSAVINVMSGAVIKAGRGLLRDFSEVGNLQVSRKGPANFVTAADIRTEKLLQRELSKARPDFGFLLEEGGEVAGKDPAYRWIIDPLDGTSNFIHAIPYFCISVALEQRSADGRSEIIAGVTYDPIHNELFSAEKGKGAYVNDRRITVSARETIEDSMLVTGKPQLSSRNASESMSLALSMAEKGATMRYLGATALDLAYLAAGRFDACWYYVLQPWDIAAGLLMVSEARGTVHDLEGAPANAYSKSLLCTNRQLQPSLQKMLARAA